MRAPSFPYPTGEELVRTYFTSYLDLENLLADKTAEWREVISQEKAIIKEDLRTISRLTDERSRWFWTEVLKVLPPARHIREALTHITRLQRLRSAARRVFDIRDPVSGTEAFDDKVTQARQVPILSVLSRVLEVKKRGRNYVAPCPFHDDKNPSLYIYPETNTFHCFGCQKGGDAIDFVREYFDYGFRQAIEYLTGGEEDDRKGVRRGIQGNRRRSRRRRQKSGEEAGKKRPVPSNGARGPVKGLEPHNQRRRDKQDGYLPLLSVGLH
jgi:hypothetical protein